jgi:hypothetical protein
MPTDDPTITGMPAIPNAPDYSNSPLAQEYKKFGDLMTRRQQLQPPNPADYKPRWTERLKGGLVGALAGLGGGGEFGARVGGGVTHRRFNTAEGTYETKRANLEDQIRAEREGIPLAEAASRIPQQGFENEMQRARLGTEQRTGQARIDQYEARVKRLQDQVDNPKATQPRNADEALSAASAARDAADKSRLIQLADDLHKQEIERAHESRPPKSDPSDKPASRAQFRGAEDKKAAARRKAEDEFDRDTKDIDLKRSHVGPDADTRYANDKAAYDEQARILEQKKRAAQDAYEADIRTLGGSVGGQDQTVPIGVPVINRKTGERRKYDPKDPKAGKDGWVILTQAQGGK